MTLAGKKKKLKKRVKIEGWKRQREKRVVVRGRAREMRERKQGWKSTVWEKKEIRDSLSGIVSWRTFCLAATPMQLRPLRARTPSRQATACSHLFFVFQLASSVLCFILLVHILVLKKTAYKKVMNRNWAWMLEERLRGLRSCLYEQKRV